MTDVKDTRDARWASEAAHTDEWVQRAGPVEPMHPLTWARYSSGRFRRRFSRDLPFSVAGSLAGKRVLDVGCGDGVDSVLLAKLGAQVSGVDVSPVAIERATRRAEMNGVADRVQFHCSPLETVGLPPDEFDVIWCWAFLHHLVADFRPPLQLMAGWCKPQALWVFHEPVNFAPWLRKLRLMTPIEAEGTPDERPLEESEFRILREFLPDLRMQHYRIVGRFDRYVLNGALETSSPLRRFSYDALTMLDYGLVQIPGVRSLCSIGVGWGHVAK